MMNRREFMMAAATAAMVTSIHSDATAVEATKAQGTDDRDTRTPPRNRHPYKDVDWSTALQIRGTTHMHCKTQAELDIILKRIEFLTISNYYPSAPWWPLTKMTENYYRLHHDFPVMVNGKRVNGPFDWNAIVGKWIKELPPELQAEYPFKEGEKLFKPLPEGVLEAPNAEHHNFKLADGKGAGRLHICAPGTMMRSRSCGALSLKPLNIRQKHRANTDIPIPDSALKMTLNALGSRLCNFVWKNTKHRKK